MYLRLWRTWTRCFLQLCLAAALLPIFFTSVSAAELDAGALFDATRLHEIVITLPADDWQQLCKQTRWLGGFGAMFSADPAEKTFTYFKGEITVDGVKISSVGIRKKGFFGSLDEVRPSLKIKFDEYVDQQPIDGLDRLTLNNNKQDASQMSQLLAYQVFNDAGVPAPRCSLTRVTVNGDYLGIYSNVESPKESFLQNHFGTSEGKLYEGSVVDFHPKSIGRLEAKNEPAEKDLLKANRLAELLATEGDLPLAELDAIVDVDRFLKFWAVESLIGFWDGYTQDQNNYFVYDDPTTDKFCFIPWGTDACFTTGGGPFAGFGGGARSEAVHAEAILPNRLYHTAGIPERYRQTMLQVLEDAWNETALLAEVDRIENMTQGHLHEAQVQSARASGWGIQALTADRVREFVRKRRDTMLGELEKSPVAIAEKPRTPMYSEEVGTARGSLKTRWSAASSQDPTEGEVQVALMLDGQEVELAELQAAAHPLQLPGFRGFGGNREWTPPATIELKGIRSSDDKPLTLTLMVDQANVTNTQNQPVQVSGMFLEGNPGFGFGFTGKMVSGTLNLSEGGTTAGDVIAGTFDVRIVEFHGGMMDRMRGGASQR